MIRSSSGNKKSDTGSSAFQSIMVAVGGRVGTGNITGTASAIFFGGPGAIFWMWIMSIICAASAFVESALAQIWKQKADDEYVGGPPYYMEKGLGWKGVGIFFAVFNFFYLIVFAALQSNAFGTLAAGSYHISPWLLGILFAVLVAVVVFGGVKRISEFAGKVVPFMSVLYILMALILMIVNISKVPAMLGLIFSSALNPRAMLGGMIGTAFIWGIKRGVFSNEAGLGTGAFVAATADVSHPAKAGLGQSLAVYIDTLLICSATAFMILSTDSYNVVSGSGEAIITHLGDMDSGLFPAIAVNSLFPGFGSAFITIAVFFFTYTTVLAYSVYLNGINHYLFKSKVKEQSTKNFMLAVNILVVLFTLVGPAIKATTIWSLASAMSGIVYFVNLLAIVLLWKPAAATLKDYERQKKAGIDPVFIPENCGIKNAELWDEIVRDDYKAEYDAYTKQFH